MPTIVKTDKDKIRRVQYGHESVFQTELAKLVAKKAGVSQERTLRVIKAIPPVIVELLIQGYAITIENFGTFFLRRLKMPGYMNNTKTVKERADCYSFAFKRNPRISKEINIRMKEKEANERMDETR